jgi:hypothetical protein
VIKPPHAPEGVQSEFGDASDLIPGAVFRFVEEDVWRVVYETHGCCCGDGPWECAYCRAEHDVIYGDEPEPSFDRRGHLYTEHEAITWSGLDAPDEVEFILAPTKTEKASLMLTLPHLEPAKEQDNARS